MRDIKVFLSHFGYSPDKVFSQVNRPPCNPIIYIEGNPYQGIGIEEPIPAQKIIVKHHYIQPLKKKYKNDIY